MLPKEGDEGSALTTPPVGAPKVRMKKRSHTLVYAKHGVAQWKKAPPSVDAARPTRCPQCGCPSRPVGKRLNVIGHGLRERSQLGPTAPNAEPAQWTIQLRRYRCKRCKAIIEVIPSSVEPYRRYSRPAIAWALALFGCECLTASAVAARLQPWRRVGATARRLWAQLRRWTRSIRNKALFRSVRRASDQWTHRRVAELAARTLASYAPDELKTTPLADRVWAGALQAR